MLDPDGLFARQFPIGLSGYYASLTLGFYQRRFDLLAIKWFVLQSWLVGSFWSAIHSAHFAQYKLSRSD